ncbi:MAG: ATP-grasp domain-containing protein [Clostridia bacterium]
MEERDSEVPLLDGVPTVGIIFNLKKEVASGPADAEAEYDNMDTVLAIQQALTACNLNVKLLQADEALPEKLEATHIDIAFNIAEGRGGRGREAQVPALLNMLGIPFTGSDETTLCIALDKALTKRLLASYHLRTPKYALLKHESIIQAPKLHYPVIVKPNAEGSSKGISDVSIASSPAELRMLAARAFSLYGQDMLAEEYIEGREFTVGVLGNGSNARVFPPMEIIYKQPTQGSYHVYSYNVKKAYKRYISYECPARLSPEQEHEMMGMAKRTFDVLGCHDFARMDFRLGDDGKIYFIEINPLPGLAPGYSDYPMLAEFSGMSYTALIWGIFAAAMQRCGLEWHRYALAEDMNEQLMCAGI